MINEIWIVKIPFKAMCCSRVFEIGKELKPYAHPTQNRLYISEATGNGHKVKRSTFCRCCEKKSEDNGQL